jgi:transposase
LTKVGTIVKIREYRDKGLTKKATAQRLGLDRKTVAKYWEGPIDDLEKPRYEERSKLTDPYVDYITNRLDEWPELTAERIYREIKSQGYTGSKRTVRRCVARLRKKTYREYKPFETLVEPVGTIRPDMSRHKVYAQGFQRYRQLAQVTKDLS